MTPPTVTDARPEAAPTELHAQPSATWGGDTQSRKEQIALGIFIVVPFLAVAAAVPWWIRRSTPSPPRMRMRSVMSRSAVASWRT